MRSRVAAGPEADVGELEEALEMEERVKGMPRLGV